MVDIAEQHWIPIDEAIYSGHKLVAIKLLKETANCPLRDAIIAIHDRYDFLRKVCSDAFLVPHEGYWDETYS